jgi:TolB-like protein/Flp pilus assembly protein TadD
MRSFLRELKRRNVYRVGAMYAVSGWLVVQVATQVFPIFDVSAGVLRGIVLAIVAGFPVALALSWVYEVTPDGIVRTADVDPQESITRQTGRKLDFVIIAVLALAVVFLFVQHYVLPRHGEAGASGSIPEKSVAVLPFESLSDEKANAYFAEGIQDEILTRLAKIGALKVISRTSTQRYASSPANLPEIARQLGVANILEGTVQKAGDSVHINVQLIRAATDEHLWAEVYNRQLHDIFQVEAEVAGAIAETLNAKLSGAEQAAVTKKPTENLAAYDAFLRARALNVAGYDFATTRKIVAAYSEAVRLDPDFALAWSYLTRTAGYMYFNGVDPDVYTADFIKRARDNAVRLAPQSIEALMAQGNYLYRIERDFAGAEQVFRRIAEREPNENEAWQLLGLVERRQGKWDLALEHLKQAAKLDPRNAGLMTSIGGETALNMRRFAEAHEWLDQALAISPGDGLALTYQAATYQSEGRLSEAAKVVDSMPLAGMDPGLLTVRIYQRLLERKYAAAIAEVHPALKQPEDALNGFGPQLRALLGKAQLWSGDKAAAAATFRQLASDLAPSAAKVDDSFMPVTLAIAQAYTGDATAARAQAQRGVELYAHDANIRPNAEEGLAEVLLLTGDRDAAAAQLRAMLGMTTGNVVTPPLLRLDPAWDALRGDAAFESLLKDSAVPAKAAGPQ